MDAEKAPALVEALGVSHVPQAWVIAKGDAKPFPVMTGVMSLVRLKQAVYRGMRVALGEIGPEDFGDQIVPGTINLTAVQGGTVGRPAP